MVEHKRRPIHAPKWYHPVRPPPSSRWNLLQYPLFPPPSPRSLPPTTKLHRLRRIPRNSPRTPTPPSTKSTITTTIKPSPTSVLLEKFTFYHGPSTQILVCANLGPKDSLYPYTRLVKWLWYVNYPWPDPNPPSAAYNALTTVTSTSQPHRYTLPPIAHISKEIWS